MIAKIMFAIFFICLFMAYGGYVLFLLIIRVWNQKKIDRKDFTPSVSLIINVPGSPKAAEENLGVILPALDHALAKIAGDTSDCAVP